jgi:hypothetical protein
MDFVACGNARKYDFFRRELQNPEEQFIGRIDTLALIHGAKDRLKMRVRLKDSNASSSLKIIGIKKGGFTSAPL